MDSKRMKVDDWRKTLLDNFRKFESSDWSNVCTEWKVTAPKNSMAWRDLKEDRITSSEKLKKTNLLPAIGRMLAENARKRKLNHMGMPEETRTMWTTPSQTVPSLMSLKVPPPQLQTKVFVTHETGTNNSPETNEKKILDILTRVNRVIQKISEILRSSVSSCVERRKSDNALCLFTFIDGLPFSLMGGAVRMDGEYRSSPPPPEAIFDAWRTQFFQSLQMLIPTPMFSKMKRSVDKGVNMDWCIDVVASEDFREMLGKVTITKLNPIYSNLWTMKPIDYDIRNEELQNSRAILIRQVEAEVRAFWTYEKIGVYLKMYYNSVG